ncbi:MAG: type II secretion system protein GspD [Desulfobacteraceae bacterium]|nr:MAG: type II secretion system protein GspD [Desulfobacteraceae bacterium]
MKLKDESKRIKTHCFIILSLFLFFASAYQPAWSQTPGPNPPPPATQSPFPPVPTPDPSAAPPPNPAPTNPNPNNPFANAPVILPPPIVSTPNQAPIAPAATPGPAPFPTPEAPNPVAAPMTPPGPALNPSAAPQGSSGYITINFNDVDLRTLIKFMSDLTGRNFLIDPSVKGNVTIISPSKVSIDEAYRVFLSVLEIHGFTTVDSGKVIKIVPAGTARTRALETLKKDEFGQPEDKIVTQLLPMQFVDVTSISKVLAPLIPQTGMLIPYQEANTLIIIDTKSNLERLMKIVTALDVQGFEESIHLFPLKFGRAEIVSKKLLPLFQNPRGRGGAPQNLKIIDDERTNTIIVLADKRTINDIKNIIDILDQEQAKPKENIHIYTLEYAVAEDLAKVLTQIPGKGQDATKGKPATISKDVQISADKATNSLVIIAEPDDFVILEGVIKQLDIQRSMVYVEALIIEVSASKSLDLGVEWRGGKQVEGGYGEGKSGGFVGVGMGPQTGQDSSFVGLAQGLMPSGFAAGVIGRAITMNGVTFPGIAAFVKAVRSDTNFNIISTPQILTMNNEDAVIEVGQTIPYVTKTDQTAATVGSTTTSIQNYEYKDVGVTLKVTPQINKTGSVRLKIEQSVKSVVSATAGSGILAPTTTFRTAKTAITIADGETAVIGGLIENRMNQTKTKAPCLGSVPVAGWIFKNTSDSEQKTNLLVFLTPHVIRNADENRALTEEKKKQLEEEEEKLKKKNKLEFPRKLLLQ